MLSNRSLLTTVQRRLTGEASSFNIDDLATALQACATLRQRDEAMASACARAAAGSAAQGSLPSLCDILYALARLETECPVLQRLAISRCNTCPQDVEALAAAELVRLLSGLGSAEGRAATAAREVISRLLDGRLEELSGPKALVQLLEAFARCGHLAPALPTALGRQVAEQMVGFSAKDVTATAVACQRLRLGNASILEALARQAHVKGRQMRPHQVGAVLAACHSGRFEHAVLQELKELKESLERRAAAKEIRQAQTSPGHDAVNDSQHMMSHSTEASVEEGVADLPLEEHPFFEERRPEDYVSGQQMRRRRRSNSYIGGEIENGGREDQEVEIGAEEALLATAQDTRQGAAHRRPWPKKKGRIAR
eukprot:gnl/TRDRNA2_/TRDRNA2_95987_c1_seq1.p1 gnl/TRDRNA2_/TRDRNA2_95987_c1~~gnl/TRDRNA2_/TRDRNA2_95987_c1_seq1.p1  ORF type:complete len:385 (-),score=74.67 gnl/TRDRNA2_/TRDRNA2_95987_c1_seq1:38-1141(-)